MRKIIKSKKAQITPEYLTMVGIILIISVPLAYYVYQTANADIRLGQAQTVADQVTAAMRSVVKGPIGTQKCFRVYMPEGVGVARTTVDGFMIKIGGRGKLNTVHSRMGTEVLSSYVHGALPVHAGVQEWCVSKGLYSRFYDDSIGDWRTVDIRHGGSVHVAGATPEGGDGCLWFYQVVHRYDDPDPDCADVDEVATSSLDYDGFYYMGDVGYPISVLSVCGDGIKTGNEQCDVGFACTPGRVCSSVSCLCHALDFTYCGDKNVDSNEQCDPPMAKSPQCPNDVECNNNCVCELCGNGQVDVGEMCDFKANPLCTLNGNNEGVCNPDCICVLNQCSDYGVVVLAQGESSGIGFMCCGSDADCDEEAGEICDTSPGNECEAAGVQPGLGCGTCKTPAPGPVCSDYVLLEGDGTQIVGYCCSVDGDCAAGLVCNTAAGNNCEDAPPGGCGVCEADSDGDGYGSSVDCDDNDIDVNPGATESSAGECSDGKDNDCDGLIDGDDPGCTGANTGGFDGCNVKGSGTDNDDLEGGTDPDLSDGVNIEIDGYLGGDNDEAITLIANNEDGIILFNNPIEITDPAATLYFDVRAVRDTSNQVFIRGVEGTSTLSFGSVSVKNLAGGTITDVYQNLNFPLSDFGYGIGVTMTGIYVQFSGNDAGNVVLFDNMCDP